MKIALVSDCFIPIKNGVVTAIVQLREGLEKEGHEVHIFTVRYRDYKETDPRVHRVFKLPAKFGNQDFGVGVAFPPRVTGLMKKLGIQLIHSHTEMTLDLAARIAARKLKIPYVHTFHTMWDDYLHYIPGGILTSKHVAKIYHDVLSPCSVVIAPSIKAKRYVLNLLPEKAVALIPNGIDVSRFRHHAIDEAFVAETRGRYGLEAADRLLLFVGRIGPEKRVIPLFDALVPVMLKNPRLKAAFVGDGGDLAVLKGKAAEAGLEKSFIFPGFIEWKEIFAIYAISSCFVTASLSEIHPMTVIESLVCGLPVIARRDDSYVDQVIPGVNGYLVDTDEEIARMASRLVFDEGLQKEFAAASLARSGRFTAEGHVRLVEALYEKVIGRWPAPYLSEPENSDTAALAAPKSEIE
jgi:1,2-diacylglycerol 3-alpha-glucosyltransferase